MNNSCFIINVLFCRHNGDENDDKNYGDVDDDLVSHSYELVSSS